MNKKGGWFGIFLIMLILAGGVIWAYSKGITPASFQKNKTIDFNETDAPRCQACDFPEIDKVAVYFDDNTNKGMNHFLDNTNSILWCAFDRLEDRDFAQRIIALNKSGIDTRVYFGIDQTMKDCDVVCVPKLESQYTYLLGEGVPVDFGRSDFNFCINEKAVFLFSLTPGSQIAQSQGLIIFSPDLKRKYETYFNSIFNK